MEPENQQLIAQKAEGDLPPLRFQQIRVQTIFFAEYLDDQFKNSRFPMPDNLRQARNTAITLGFVEIICCFASFLFYDVERSRIILALCVLNCVATGAGFYAKLCLAFWGLLAHTLWNISVIGGFYIYIIIDICLRSDEEMHPKVHQTGLSDTWVLVLSSLPLFGLFLMGIYSAVLLLMTDEELEIRKKVLHEANQAQQAPRAEGQIQPLPHVLAPDAPPRQDYEGQTVSSGSQNEIQENLAVRDIPHSYTLESLAKQEHIVEVLEIKEEQKDNFDCVICMNKEKDTCFYPCGHKCLCFECAQRFRKEARHQVCPLCRNRVKDILKVYEY